MVWVVSEEKFAMHTKNITALVALRSSTTKKGLIALDTGIVDEFFEGPIGSVIINYSNDPVTIKEHEKFFRVLFFQHDNALGFEKEKVESDHDMYNDRRIDEIMSSFPDFFLQRDKMVEDVKAEILQSSEISNLRNSISDQVLLHTIKTYPIRILLLILLFAGSVIGASYLLIDKYGLPITKEQISELAEKVASKKIEEILGSSESK